MIAAIETPDLERFRSLIARVLGLQFEDAKLAALADVLRLRVEATRQTVTAYLDWLQAGAPSDELTILAQHLTVGETYFFRHAEQYKAFAEVALPDRLAHAAVLRSPVRILSAGCASGEEPYSLAIVTRDAAIDQAGVSIRGVDINTAFLEKARHGRYSSWALRETATDVRARWFQPASRDFVLDERVRRAVSFEVANLADECSDLWQTASVDIVFCRNVLMYFVASAAQDVVRRFARLLRPGGFLFLGHAETLRGLSIDFHLRHTHETFYYQCKDHIEVRPPTFTLPGRARSPAALVELVDEAGTWVEAIRRASARIEALARSPLASTSHSEAPLAAPPAWETGLALELLREERFAEALQLVETFPPESERDTEVLLLRAVLLTSAGRLNDAERACERLLAIDELNAGAHYVLALCREGRGDRPGAVHHDQVATYLDSGFAMARLHLGLLARRAGDLPTARRELEQAVALVRREEASRLLLFSGGFSRDSLVALCRAELASCGGPS